MENNNKNVKKNKKPLVIVAMVLMVALVVGMGAMTYSKYISTTDVPAQTATAAKWGFVVSATTDKLFGDQYSTDSVAPAYAKVDGGSTVVVNANPDANIVAPGTTGYLLITVNGSAEVRAKLTAQLNVTQNITDGNGYNPIQWALVNGDSDPTNETVWTNSPATVLNSLNATFEPGASANGAYRLYWRWNFSSSTENDVKDTIIGALASNPTIALNDLKAICGDDTLTAEKVAAYKTQLEFNVTLTMEQIQADTP